MEIKIYSKPNCVYCEKAKIELAKHNPTILMLDVDYTKEEFFNLFPYAKTFPQIIINGNKIGGYSELDGLSF